MPRKKAAAPAVVEFNSEQIDSVLHLPPYTLAIDPGETCGFAVVFDPVRPGVADLNNHYATGSLPMLMFLDYLTDNPHLEDVIQQVVVEEYRIFPDKAMMHSGKTVPTAECIGAIKHIARCYEWPLVEQAAGIKEPMAGLLGGRGFKSIGKNRHEKDAELHLWYHALRGQKGTNAR